MNPIKIESRVPVEKVNHIIKENLIEKYVDMKYEKHENRIRYIFSLNKNQTNNSTVLKALSKIAYEIIKVYYLDDIIELNIDKKIEQVGSKNKAEILEDVKDVLLSRNLFGAEKNIIQEEIYEYLLENNTLVIDGYLNFRSESITDLIEKAIDLVLGNFQVDVDYEEFIEMLKSVVTNQKTDVELVNIVLEDGKYSVLDKNLNEIENEVINEALNDIADDDDKVGDIDKVLSIVLTLSPEKIIIHLGEQEVDELIFLLEDIFEGRVEICRNCKLCNK